MTRADLAPATNRVVRGLVWAAGGFLAAVALVMIVGQIRQPREEPWRSPALAEAKAQLQADPKNEALKERIRMLDVRLRQAYFRGLERDRTGAWLLLAGGVLLVVAARSRILPAATPSLRGPIAGAGREQGHRRARWTVLGVGATFAVLVGGLGWLAPSRLPASPGVLAGAGGPGDTPASAPPAAAARWPTPEALAANWPRFLGAAADGTAAGADLPLRWDAAKGEGVVWKTPVPLPGYNSPVVWEDRVFLTGGDRKARLVFCFDASNGTLLWQRPVVPTNAAPQRVEIPDQSGAAACTVATDGERVFAIFGTGELGALDFDGQSVWHRRLDVRENSYGHAASLVVWQDRLLVQADQGAEEDGKSQLLALDTRTGNPLWTVKRPVGAGWTTPIVVEAAGRPQLVAAGDPWLMAYDPAGGGELWRARILGGELAPSPVLAAGMVIAVSPGKVLAAVRPDGSGDVTASHVAWKLETEVPDVPSPAVAGDLLFTASTEGHVFCREAATGTKLWEHDYELEFQATPLVAGDRVYLFAQPGNVIVLRAARTFEELAAFEMGEEVYASPGVARNRLFVRTHQNLYCLGASAGAPHVADAR